MIKILMVEDDEELADIIQRYLLSKDILSISEKAKIVNFPKYSVSIEIQLKKNLQFL